MELLKKRRKRVYTHLSRAGPLKAALCVYWAGFTGLRRTVSAALLGVGVDRQA